jgi:predicted nucleic acid-binding protein
LAVNVYLDPSVIVPLFIDDSFNNRADAALRGGDHVAIVSDFAKAEFASAIARSVRIGETARDLASAVFSRFDVWIEQSAEYIEICSADLASASTHLRRLDLNLRAPDAIHVAVAMRIGATLLTFDDKMTAAAKMLGVPVAAA